jgi:uncharacterized membrane protein
VAWYVAAVAVALAGIVAAIAIGFGVYRAYERPVQFLAPGRCEIDAAKPGPYTIWLEYRTVFENRTWDISERMPGGARFRITGPDGSLSNVRASGGGSWKSGETERVSVGGFTATLPGRYTVSVEGEFEPRVLSVGRDMTIPLLKALGAAVASVLVGAGAGIAIGLYAFLKRIPSGPVSPPAAAPVMDALREQKLRELTVLVYGLQAVALAVGVTLIAGVIVNYLRRDEVAGTWLESHFTWQIRTFWWTMLWTIIGLATVVVLVGFVILLAAAVWFVYRIAKGWTELNDGRPVAS